MNGFLKSALCAVALTAAGCGGGDKKPDGAAPAKPAAGKPAAAAPAGGAAYDAAKSTASVKGVVKWTGPKPAQTTIQMSSDTVCQSHAGPGVANPKFVVADGGGLPNAFVWALEGPHKGMTGFPEPAAVTVDQVGCMYTPHVVGLRVNQKFTVKNSDNTTHNVHVRPKSGGELNQAQSVGQHNEFSFAAKEKAIPFNCDIHTWMSAFAFVLDHPFFSATDANGNFEVKGLPAGTYKFKVWHESFIADKREMETDFEVTVKDGETVTKDVELK